MAAADASLTPCNSSSPDRSSFPRSELTQLQDLPLCGPFTTPAKLLFRSWASTTTSIEEGEMPPVGQNVWGTRWLRQRVTDPLILIIRRGAEPKTLAFSGALGMTLGIFPIYGVTALLCGCAVALLGGRCNAPTMLLANLIATPLELSLVIPFLRLGEWIVGGKRLLLSKDALWQALTGRASWEVLVGLLHALVGWSVAAPLIVTGLYFALLPMVNFYIQRSGVVAVSSSSLKPLMKDAIV